MTIGVPDLKAAVPDCTSTVRLAGLEGLVEIWRDRQGVPHLQAGSIHDAFFAQGYVHAQDRLWLLEYDRRRAAGRWAEYAGASAVEQDVLMRRFRLVASAQADYAAFDAPTRAVFDAYAAGVNAFIATSPALPVEYQIVGGAPEPWQPWESCAVYKVRHVLMGVWGQKLWRARLLRTLGPELLLRLRAGAAAPGPLIMSPGAEYTEIPDGDAGGLLAEIGAGTQEPGAGSNSWVLHGSRTASGLPLLAGDPHRALEVPNVYYQNHLACPDFDAIGFSFAGVPGFPHFGHNAQVAWCVTHASADYQDLYVERFTPGEPPRYEYQGEWLPAEQYHETVLARDAAPVEFDVTVTRHGPVVVGEPADRYALALRYSATAAPNQGFAALLPMLRAASVDELDAAMRPWVDPCNNFLMADVHGTIGYLMRGEVPVRARANAWLPVPGWTGAHEWTGAIPFEELPRVRDPETGYIVTANNRVVGDDYPHYLSLDYAPPFRAQRVVVRVEALTGATVADMAAIHADTRSLPAQSFLALLDRVMPLDERSARAKALLTGWDGTMGTDAVAATLYAVWREETVRLVLEGPVLRPLTAALPYQEPLPLRQVLTVGRLRAPLLALMGAGDESLLPPGTTWPEVLAQALARATAWLAQRFGADMASWQWGQLHRTAPRHTLATAFPDLANLLNPPAVGVGGDGDTPQASAFGAPTGDRYAVIVTSVARYVFDLADWDRSGWVVPLGASGHPGSAHYADQLAAWRDLRLHPMLYSWDTIAASAEARQRLEPDGSLG